MDLWEGAVACAPAGGDGEVFATETRHASALLVEQTLMDGVELAGAVVSALCSENAVVERFKL